MVFAKMIRGNEGKATIPSPGAVVGTMYQWTLQAGEDGKSYTLKATFNSLHELLWDEAGSSLRIELRISKDKWYEARPLEGVAILRDGRQLTIKGVELCQLER